MSKQKWLDYALYISVLSVIAGSILFFNTWRKNAALESSSETFMRVLEKNDIQAKKALIEENNIYSEMMKLYLFVQNDPEYQDYIEKHLPEIMCTFPSFIRCQFIALDLLRRNGHVDEADMSHLTFGTEPGKNPWTAMARWIRISVNHENDNGQYSNAAFDKNQQDMDQLIDSNVSWA